MLTIIIYYLGPSKAHLSIVDEEEKEVCGSLAMKRPAFIELLQVFDGEAKFVYNGVDYWSKEAVMNAILRDSLNSSSKEV